ncbi:uncharacterized protein LOC111006026 [Momordica charantia]|uniref:Uncharacterized protein LOC111006026 n=1 Tax=Momordica charantia TaxID=3673 RepID=A0A6J1BW10_MOMCH|nr:uncharacterized protein LOC111006026 [Momordica charantia]
MVNLPSHLLIFLFFYYFLHPVSSFTLPTLSNNPNFDPHVALIGDAAVVHADADADDSFVKLTRPVASSFGLVLNAKPLRLHDSSSFSTQFAFWVSPDNGDGLVLSLFPGSFELSREKWIHAIEFVSANVSNLSGGYLKTERGVLVPTIGGKLTSWVDFDSSSKMVEIRLSKFGDSRPYDPSFAYPIDLASKCEGEEVFVGLSSWNSKPSQWSRVFSWRFGLRNIPKGMHSLPVDPQRRSEKQGEELQKNHLLPLTIFAGLIFATGCGALMAFVVLFMWVIAANRNAIFAAEPQSVDFQYQKVSVVVVEEGLKDVSTRG